MEAIGATGPEVVEGDNHRCPHMLWAMWEEDEEGVDAHLGFFRTRDGLIAIQSMQSNRDVRGRDMLKWIAGYGLPVHVVEVVPEAMGFWDRMMAEGRVVQWDPATGWPSELERRAVSFPEALKEAA